MQGQGSAQNALLKRIISVKTTNNESKMTYERSSKQNATHGVSMWAFSFIYCKERSQTCVGSCCWVSSQHFCEWTKKTNINFSDVTGNLKVNIKSFKMSILNYYFDLLSKPSLRNKTHRQVMCCSLPYNHGKKKIQRLYIVKFYA